MFQYNKLLGRMTEKKVIQKRAASALSISENSFTNKIKGRSNFTSEEIATLCDLLDIEKDEIGTYFFTVEVWKFKLK